MPEFNPGGAASLNQAVKQRYEANADTNAFSDSEKAKLAAIANAATVNATDAALRDRATHTGTQPQSSIDNLATDLAGKADAGHGHATLPTTAQKAALDNANAPTSGNPFLTQSDLTGGLPTGQIPGDFVNFDGDPQGGPFAPQETTDGNWVDITGMDLTVVTASPVPVRSVLSYTVSRIGGGGGDTTAAFRIVRIEAGSPVEVSLGMQSTIDANAFLNNGSVNFRTAALPAGTYTFRPQFRRVAGTQTVQFIRGQFQCQAQQAPKGDTGPGLPVGGTAGQVARKASGTDYDVVFATLGKGDVGLGNVDNTADADKPVSTATQSALDGKSATGHTHVAANITDFAAAVAATSAVTANTAKVTNATHTGDVTGATTLTIANDAVTNAKLANVPTTTLKGRVTAGTGDPEDLTAAQARTVLNVADGATANASDASLRDRSTHTGTQTAATISDFATAVAATAAVTANTAKVSNATHTGDVTGATALTIANDAVTYAKMQNVSAASRLLGRGDSGTGDPQEITLGSGLTMTGTTLSASGGGGVGDGDKGDITVSGSGTVWTVDNGVVSLAKMADVATARLFGRVTGGTGVPEVLTGTQATTLLDTFTTSLKGLAPASGGGTTNFLRSDGTWAAPGGGGSGDVVGPASATNNALVRFDTTTGKLIQSSAALLTDLGEVQLPSVAAPAIPAADTIGIFGRKVASRMMPAFIGPSGLDSALQPLIARNKIGWWQANGNAQTSQGMGLVFSTAGTATTRNVAATNLFTRLRRVGYVSATTAAAFAALRSAAAQFSTGDGAGLGGFTFVTRFGLSAITADCRMFVGMTNSTAAPTNVEPSTLINCIGVGRRAADTNLQLFYGGSTAQTPIDLGANFPANTVNVDAYEIALFSPPNVTGTVHYEVTRLNTGHVATGTLSGAATILPQSGTLLGSINAWITNNATAAAVAIDFASIYVESDF